VAGQDVATAQRNLAANQVEVAEVKDYSPQADTSSLRAMADFPLALKSGDKVTLYQQNGRVQYYSIVKPVQPAAVDANTVARIDQDVQTLKTNIAKVDAVRTDLEAVKASSAQSTAQLDGNVAAMKAQLDEIARLKAELAAVQQSAAEKDGQIMKLQADVTNMQAAQRDINARFSPDKLAALEQQVQQLVKVRASAVSPPTGPATAAPTRKTTTKTTKPKGKGK
jgi:hypothetical protein